MAGEQTFPLTMRPTQGGAKNTAAKTLVAEFGDGFIQRAGDGINAIRDSFGLTWVNLSQVQLTEATDFLKARAGHEAFLWTPLRESVPRKFICPKWSTPFGEGTRDTLAATFEEVFDL